MAGIEPASRDPQSPTLPLSYTGHWLMPMVGFEPTTSANHLLSFIFHSAAEQPSTLIKVYEHGVIARLNYIGTDIDAINVNNLH